MCGPGGNFSLFSRHKNFTANRWGWPEKKPDNFSCRLVFVVQSNLCWNKNLLDWRVQEFGSKERHFYIILKSVSCPDPFKRWLNSLIYSRLHLNKQALCSGRIFRFFLFFFSISWLNDWQQKRLDGRTTLKEFLIPVAMILLDLCYCTEQHTNCLFWCCLFTSWFTTTFIERWMGYLSISRWWYCWCRDVRQVVKITHLQSKHSSGSQWAHG